MLCDKLRDVNLVVSYPRPDCCCWAGSVVNQTHVICYFTAAADQVSEILQQVFELQAQAGQSTTEQVVKAAVIGDLATIEELFSAASTPVSVDDSVSGHTALHAACQHGHLDVAKYLLSKSASTNNEVS